MFRATVYETSRLDVLFDRCERQDDPRPVVQAIERELAEPESGLCQQFRQTLGLEVNAAVRRVLEFILHEDHVPVDLLTPELIGGEPALGLEECIGAVEYLQRTGCMAVHSDMVSIETTLKGVISLP
jgi:antitoxin component of RelBE/YafQ-DinJ toxin-antitoxin module